MVQTFKYTLREHKDTDVPLPSEAVDSALQFMNTMGTWKKGKTYTPQGQTVETFHQRIDGDFWMARVSRHKDVTFEQFKEGILENHTEKEVQYIPLLDSFKRLDKSSECPDWESILVHYKFPRFFSDREMTVWILAIQPDENKKQFVVISIPSDRPVTDHESVTRAYYCSIEVVTYLEDQQCVEWKMAQTSDAKGNIPRWIQDSSVTASVIEDVPHFIAWIKAKAQ